MLAYFFSSYCGVEFANDLLGSRSIALLLITDCIASVVDLHVFKLYVRNIGSSNLCMHEYIRC